MKSADLFIPVVRNPYLPASKSLHIPALQPSLQVTTTYPLQTRQSSIAQQPAMFYTLFDKAITNRLWGTPAAETSALWVLLPGEEAEEKEEEYAMFNAGQSV
ncbi:hypothetical protein VTN00DRAFT_8883 [Thermoascus crustaceus]|uniref:uncharacterized protein n=1 Tax=Thermoascus crustaceus TaxID=5088 RepID=UPI003743946F